MSSKHGIPKSEFKPLLSNKVRQLAEEDVDINCGYHLHKKKLGEGGFGTVRLATHLKTGQKVAVKIMNKMKLGHDLFRVHIEISALKALQHENIAKLLQVIENENEIYLVLEYCSGGELFDYLLSKQRLTEKETKIIMRDLANVLNFIHENGFAHRDLKPENILFDENRRIKLIDFGLSANCQDLNSTLSHLSTCCGSPAYAAPELLEGNGYSGSAVDVWSAGILLYALLVGRLPFDSENVGVLYKKIQSGFYYSPNWLSSEAQDLIKCMLKTNPMERFTIKDVLSHPWLRLNEEKQEYKPLNSRRLSFDEVFWKCKDLFPETPINFLRQNILTGFGYQTATYWLIKQNPDFECSTLGSQIPVLNEVIKNPNQRRRSRSFANFYDNENIPQVIGVKRKMIECETLKDFQIKRSPPNQSDPKVCKELNSKRTANRELLANSPLRITALKTSAKTPKVKDSIKLAKTKYLTPIVPQRSPRVFGVINGEESRGLSPLRNFVKSFTSKTVESTETTTKKSLFKRLLETATPSKSNTPKILSLSTDPKNIILTKFADPQLCINKLVEILKARGLQCKQKSFSLRCVLSSMNVIILSFDLEICMFENRCVIQRKRLKGDSWHYKRICEEILKISNQ